MPATATRSYLAVVRQGDAGALESLYEHLGQQGVARDLVEVCVDRRVGDRRAVRQVILPERRRRDRRGPEAETWRTRGFVLVRGGAPSRSLAPADGAARPGPLPRIRLAPTLEAPPAERPRAPAVRPRLGAVAGAAAAGVARPAGLPAFADPRLRSVVLLAKVGAVTYPGFYDPAVGGWRCGRCDGIVMARAPGADTPRRGEVCVGCRAEIVRVLRSRWQRVNWVTLVTLTLLALIAARTVWPLVSRML